MKAVFLSVFLLILVPPSLVLGAETWVMAESENLTLISNAGEKKAQRVFEEVQFFRAGLRIAFDGRFRDLKWPLKVYVFKNARTMDAYAPERGRGERRFVAYYQRGQGYDLIVINSSTDPDELRRIVFHEFAHRMVEDLGYLPPWLDEGYASVFEEFSIDDRKVKFGLGSQYYVDFLANGQLLPLERLFAVHHGSEEYTKEGKVSSFYATSWAFVHMCLFARDRPYTEAFFKFASDIRDRPLTEDLFIEDFGMTYREMERKLRSYVDGGDYFYRIVDVPAEIEIPRLEFVEMTTFSQNLHLASVQTHSMRLKEARSSLLRCEYELPTLSASSSEQDRARHSQIAAEFATLESRAGNRDVMSDYAAQAFELGTRSPTALMIHAESLLGVKDGWAGYKRLGVEELQTVLDMLMVVLGYNFKNERAHVAHSYAWTITEVRPLESHIGALIRACQLFPENAAIHLNLSRLFQRLERNEEAKAVLVHLINNTSDPSARRNAAERLAELENPG